MQLETTKQFIVGRQKTLPPLSAYGNNFYDRESMGWWDAYRRITMLEPLAADVLFPPAVPGDFLEAGVFRGGVSLYLATLLRVFGALGSAEDARHMWMVDAFGNGMPNNDYSTRLAERVHIRITSIETQNKNWTNQFAGDALSRNAVSARVASGLGLEYRSRSPIVTLGTAGIYSIPGYFNDSLSKRKGHPIDRRRIAILRIDVDEFAATLEVFERLYPRLSIGGYVVLDDWKVWQAQQAALYYRRKYNITSSMFASKRQWALPLQSIDCMVFWKKTEEVTED